jgi:hypothetical protein
LTYANDSVQAVADAAYAALSNAIASIYSPSSRFSRHIDDYYYQMDAATRSRSLSNMGESTTSVVGGDEISASARGGGGGPVVVRRRKSFTLPSADLVMLLNNNNPYSTVRGRDHSQSKPASISSVRALLALVPVVPLDEEEEEPGHEARRSLLPPATTAVGDGDGTPEKTRDGSGSTTAPFVPMTPVISNVSPAPDGGVPPLRGPLSGSDDSVGHRRAPRGPSKELQQQILLQRRREGLAVSPSETASQIAEGTIRAMRDVLCDEAVELQMALRFWTERWERPLFSWLEAGPRGT